MLPQCLLKDSDLLLMMFLWVTTQSSSTLVSLYMPSQNFEQHCLKFVWIAFIH